MDHDEYSLLQRSIVGLVKNLTSIHKTMSEDKIKSMPDYQIWEILLNRDPNNDLQRIFTECDIDVNKLSKTSNEDDEEEEQVLICKKKEKNGKERTGEVASGLVNQKVDRLFQNPSIKTLKQLLINLKEKFQETDTGWTTLRVFQSIPFFFSLYKYHPKGIIHFFESSKPMKDNYVWFHPRNKFYDEIDSVGNWNDIMMTLRGGGTLILFDEKIFCHLMKFDYDSIFEDGKIIDNGSLQSESWKNYFKNITVSCSSFLYKKLVLHHLNYPSNNFLNNYLKKEDFQELNDFLKNRNFIEKSDKDDGGFYCNCKICKKSPKFFERCDNEIDPFPKKSSILSCMSTPIDPNQIFPIPIEYEKLFEYQLLNSGIQFRQQSLKVGHAAPAMGGKRKKRKSKKNKKSIKRKRKKKSIKRR